MPKFLSRLATLFILTTTSVLVAELPPPPPLAEPAEVVSEPKPLPETPVEPAKLAVPEFDSLNVPDGFEVTLYADNELAHDIYSLTVDSFGRVVVSGAGYVKILIDKDNNGVADEARLFADGPQNGAMGMYFHGRDLICTGDAGLIRYTDRNGDDHADGEPDVFLKMKTGGEHDAHAIRRGPDGWWYVIAGNNANITAAYATLPTSPVKHPEAGTLMRLKPDLTGGEILAQGMRNAYDFDFNVAGDIFTFDSDGERDISLPWYRPTRVFQLLPAADCGWISRSWKRPDDFLDMPPVLGSFGRGSPTGVLCYRHTNFPKPYRGALFVQDWTFGRVMVLPMQIEEGVWKSEPREFMTAKGQFGFAPTDMAVGPDGSLYVSVGGRGTRGSIFKVRWKGDESDKWAAESPDSLETQLTWCLRAPEPLSSWSRALWTPVATKLGSSKFRQAALDLDRPIAYRLRAIEIMTELFNGLELSTVKYLGKDARPAVRARAIWSLGRHLKSSEGLALAVEFVNDGDPLVARSALEALLTAPPDLNLEIALPALARKLGAEERFVRQSAARVVARLWPDHLSKLREITAESSASTIIFRELGIVWNRRQPSRGGVEIGVAVLEGDYPSDLKLEAARLVELALGDVGPYRDRPPVYDGYAPRLDLETIERTLDTYRIRLANLYPLGDERVDREVLRLVSILEPYNINLLDKILAGLTSESHPTDDIERLIVASRIPVERNYQQTELIAKTLVRIDYKVAALDLKQDSNWGDRMTELFTGLMKHDPALGDVIVQQPEFGLPGHVMFLAGIASADSLPKAIAGFVRQIEADPNYSWTNDVVFVLGESDDPAHEQLIRGQFENYSVQSAVLSVLALDPKLSDREWFVEGLSAPLFPGVEASVNALAALGPGDDPKELFELLGAARRLSNNRNEFEVREKIMAMLQKVVVRDLGFIAGREGHMPQPEAFARCWNALSEQYPEQARQQLGTLADELTSLATLLGTASTEGDAATGKMIFEKRSCARCHGGSRALGPDLAGVAQRFSEHDLLTSIANPNQDVSARYQTTMIVTEEGKVYTGMIVYESVDGLILRDAEGKTYRIEATEIEHQRKLSSSLMPEGLLKNITVTELSDLFAYLRSLKK